MSEYKIHSNMKHALSVSLLVTVLMVVGSTGCKSYRSQAMLVARVDGDIYLPAIRSVVWNEADSVDCELASQQFVRQPAPPDDLLLCGQKTLLAWSVTWLRSDIKAEIYRAAEKRTVIFHRAGHGRGSRNFHRYWNCRWTSEHIDCN
jgi:hypothetical protein